MKMARILLLGLFVFCVGCNTKVSQDDIQLLNGYWEIEKVTLADGQIKEYTVNTAIDYIEVSDLAGFRKKVYPKLDGTFDTTNDAEKFTVINTNGTFEMSYKRELSTWTEQLVAINKKSFSVINEDNITYHYKRFEPITINN